MSYHYLGENEKCYAISTILAHYNIRATIFDRFTVALRLTTFEKSIPGHGVKVGGKKRTKNVRFWMIEGWDCAHCLAFLEAPHFDVKHLEIGQETKKLGPFPPKCHEFKSRTQQCNFSHQWPRTVLPSPGIEPRNPECHEFDSRTKQSSFTSYKTNIYLMTSFR